MCITGHKQDCGTLLDVISLPGCNRWGPQWRRWEPWLWWGCRSPLKRLKVEYNIMTYYSFSTRLMYIIIVDLQISTDIKFTMTSVPTGQRYKYFTRGHEGQTFGSRLRANTSLNDRNVGKHPRRAANSLFTLTVFVSELHPLTFSKNS